jgi:hypothetical protein
MYGSYRKKGRNLKELRAAYPPTIDPLYDETKEVLIGDGMMIMMVIMVTRIVVVVR